MLNTSLPDFSKKFRGNCSAQYWSIFYENDFCVKQKTFLYLKIFTYIVIDAIAFLFLSLNLWERVNF